MEETQAHQSKKSDVSEGSQFSSILVVVALQPCQET